MTFQRSLLSSLRRPALIAALLVCASCAGGGGSTGTGITTAQGTIASATASRPATSARGSMVARIFELLGAPRIANALAGVEGIRVSIAGSGLTTESDGSGFFALSGSFGGPVTIVFESGDGPPARLDVNVPTGGTLTLDRVRLDGPDDRARPDAQRLEFEGVVSSANCPGGSLSMVSSSTPDDGNSYPVDVGSAQLRDADGNAIQCDDLGSGDVLSVQGDVRDDGGIDCREADRRPGGPGPGPGGMP